MNNERSKDIEKRGYQPIKDNGHFGYQPNSGKGKTTNSTSANPKPNKSPTPPRNTKGEDA